MGDPETGPDGRGEESDAPDPSSRKSCANASGAQASPLREPRANDATAAHFATVMPLTGALRLFSSQMYSCGRTSGRQL